MVKNTSEFTSVTFQDTDFIKFIIREVLFYCCQSNKIGDSPTMMELSKIKC